MRQLRIKKRLVWIPRMAGLAVTVIAWRVLRLKRGVSRARAYWEDRSHEIGRVVYVALGDSAAQGVGARHPKNGYVGIIADRISAALCAPVRVVNLSVSGARVADVVRDQLPRVNLLNPYLVTVAIGGNDIRHFERESFSDDIVRLCGGLPAGTFIADMPYFAHGQGEELALFASEVLRKNAEQHGLIVVPLYEALRVQRRWTIFTNYAIDLFHPNSRGYRVWADAFWSVIVEKGLRSPAA